MTATDATPGHDTIGLLAPVLLVVARLAQGLSASGECWGSSPPCWS
jgi:hypothetical protein